MLADVLSVLAMTMSVEGKRESLEYKLVGSGGKVTLPARDPLDPL